MKNYGRESVNGDFPCAKLENAKKIMDVRVLTGLVCPAARPLGVRQYPGALKGCGVKRIHKTLHLREVLQRSPGWKYFYSCWPINFLFWQRSLRSYEMEVDLSPKGRDGWLKAWMFTEMNWNITESNFEPGVQTKWRNINKLNLIWSVLFQ